MSDFLKTAPFRPALLSLLGLLVTPAADAQEEVHAFDLTQLSWWIPDDTGATGAWIATQPNRLGISCDACEGSPSFTVSVEPRVLYEGIPPLVMPADPGAAEAYDSYCEGDYGTACATAVAAPDATIPRLDVETTGTPTSDLFDFPAHIRVSYFSARDVRFTMEVRAGSAEVLEIWTEHVHMLLEPELMAFLDRQ